MRRTRSVKVLYFSLIPRAKPFTKSIPYYEGEVSFRSLLNGHPSIPIHTTIVTIKADNKFYIYRLDYRFDSIFLTNTALLKLDHTMPFLGDMVVTCMGDRNKVVNMATRRQRDYAVKAVRDFLSHYQERGRIPTSIFRIHS
ncbi:hypothetical protein CC1G_08712 [Coprinopsis cinerea okayama7|uniref:Uncharacterized protein n=1 Tax=Coprinopsis cinerea (strain Okayama-7 / 130 / ATCC MYA-4618 / FGSC 9003) TaxID=240176 RepID=A8NZJ6_COPC7|nr:hypothetical protein CC1G_08712 [Coprinopsis cinerea okayama7\|eukprot:XP_001837699.1 hypothetical protein CC1G_08712 [Coprinopsis cinerea okayama7\